MRAEELRIGNWVNWNGENGVISQILEYEVVFKCGEDTLISDLKPIELTEEILLKCGFVKDAETSYRWYLGEYFTYDLDDGGFKYEGIWIRPLIKHLHQLQNIYFALCNKELNVQL